VGLTAACSRRYPDDASGSPPTAHLPRPTSSTIILGAFAVSAAIHATALLAPMGRPGYSGAVRDTVDVAVYLEPAPAEPTPTVDPAPSRGTIFTNHVHPDRVPASYEAIPHAPDLFHPAAPRTVPAAAAPADTTADESPSFTIVVGPTSGGDSFGKVSAIGTAPHVDAPAAIPEQWVDTPARLVHGIAPSYPPMARANTVEGDVRLELIVGAYGNVESARIVLSAGHGFDEAALQAARQFRFAPAMKDGRAVRVRMAWSMQFRLQ
jgi:TonB family protein